jgi:secreted Zn-dependent insulinase-like peptidase
VAVAAQVINPNEDNSAVELYLQVGPHGARSQALTDVLEQLMFEPVYDTLRTKEQLGYTVGAGARNTMGVLGFCVVVQSSLFGVVEVVERIEAFLTSFVSTIADMEMEAYDKQLQSLVALKLQKDKSPGDESDRHWDQIWQEVYDFSAREKVVEEIKKVTKGNHSNHITILLILIMISRSSSGSGSGSGCIMYNP